MLTEQQMEAMLQAELASQQGKGGVLPEVAKGVGRGVLGIPNLVMQAGDWLESKMPTPEWSKVPIPSGVQEGLAAANEYLKPTPTNRMEQMAGTGAEIFTGGLIGGPAGAGKRVLSAAIPAAGGVAGEQALGEAGQLVGTLAAPFAAAGVSRALNPKTPQAAKNIIDKGVNLTPGQTLGEPFNSIERLPIIREFTSSASVAANKQWQKSVYEDALRPVGGKVTDIGHKGFEQAHTLASQAYDKALTGAKPFQWTPNFQQELSQAIQGIPVGAARERVVELFRSANHFNRGDTPIWRQNPNKFNGAMHITPQEYKEVDSLLGEAYRRYSGKQFENADEIAEGIEAVQRVFRQHMAAQNPANAQAIKNADAAYRNLSRVRQAVVTGSAKGGEFTPGSLMEAIRSADTTKAKTGVALGRSPMQQTAQEGIEVLGEPIHRNIPPSMLMGALGSSLLHPYGYPVAAAGAGMTAAYSPFMRGKWPGILSSRSPGTRAFGQAMMPDSPLGFGLAGSIPLFSQGQQ